MVIAPRPATIVRPTSVVVHFLTLNYVIFLGAENDDAPGVQRLRRPGNNRVSDTRGC